MANNFVLIQSAITNLLKELGEKLELVGAVVESAAVNNIDDMSAVDTGRLRNSITHVTDKDNLSTKIGTNVEYAPFVCFGTVKMAPRPFLRLSLYESENEIIEIMKK